MISPSEAFDLAKRTGQEVVEDNCLSMSAAIAYYALLSLPPLLAILVGIAGVVFGVETVQEQLTGQVGGLVGPEGAAQIRAMIDNAGDLGGGSLMGKLLGLLALLFGATGAFVQLQQSLNRAWEVEPDPASGGLKNFVTKRILSFGMVMTIAFLLIVSLAASAALTALFGVIEGAIGPAGAAFARIGELAVSLGLFTVLFAAIFRALPDAQVEWRDVWAGAAVTAVLFVIGKFLIGFYLGQSNPGEAFGAAGSVVVLLVWIYYTALILLVGAEFTQLWAVHTGSRIQPAEDAVRVVESQKKVVRQNTSPETKSDDEDAGESEGAKATHPYGERRDPQPREGWNEEPERDREA